MQSESYIVTVPDGRSDSKSAFQSISLATRDLGAAAACEEAALLPVKQQAEQPKQDVESRLKLAYNFSWLVNIVLLVGKSKF